jgi:hypothetical protein
MASNGEVLGTTKIVDAGPPEQRWNAVIVSEGYRKDEMKQFADDAKAFADALLTAAPFDRLRAAINIFRVDVTSTESGAKDPTKCKGTGAKPRTFFDASFCSNGIRRLLIGNNNRVLKVAHKQVPQSHMVFLSVNSPISGGSGGSVATFSQASGAMEIAIHEMGHTAFGLADEYEYYSGCATDKGHDKHSKSEPSEPNVTTNNDRTKVKWRDLIQDTTPVPTTRNGNCANCDPQPSPVAVGTIGLFEGGDYFHCGVYRPEFDCRMRNLNRPFCGVCQQVIVKRLTPFLPH